MAVKPVEKYLAVREARIQNPDAYFQRRANIRRLRADRGRTLAVVAGGLLLLGAVIESGVGGLMGKVDGAAETSWEGPKTEHEGMLASLFETATDTVSDHTGWVNINGGSGVANEPVAQAPVETAEGLAICPTVLTDPMVIDSTVSKAINDLNRDLFPAGADLGRTLDPLWENYFAGDNPKVDVNDTNGAPVVLRELVSIDKCTIG